MGLAGLESVYVKPSIQSFGQVTCSLRPFMARKSFWANNSRPITDPIIDSSLVNSPASFVPNSYDEYVGYSVGGEC